MKYGKDTKYDLTLSVASKANIDTIVKRLFLDADPTNVTGQAVGCGDIADLLPYIA